MTETKDKAVAEEKKPRPKKPRGYREFEKLLKQVVNVPPLRKGSSTSTAAECRQV